MSGPKRKPLAGRSGGSADQPSRDRRDAQAAARTPLAFPLRVNAKGELEIVFHSQGAIGIDPSRGAHIIVHPPLKLVPGSPYGVSIEIDDTLSVLDQRLSSSPSTTNVRDGQSSLDITLARLQATKQSRVEKDQPDGYAGLDSSGLVPLAELPAIPASTVCGFPVLLPEDGADGEPGPPGPAGADGAAGSAGATGAQGPTGPALFMLGEAQDGEPGPPGRDGAAGAAGANGATGAQGPIGPPIFMLQEGDPGEQGNPGAQGNPGVTGAQGPTGPAIFLLGDYVEGEPGNPGSQGNPGTTGAQGPAGPAVFLLAEDGEQGLPGPQGARGYPGSSYMGFMHDGSLYAAKRILSCLTCVGLAAFTSTTANRFYVVAGEAPDDTPSPSITKLGVEVTTAVAASTIYLHAYSNVNGYPARFLGTASVSSAATGIVEASIGLRLQAGQKFFVAMACDAAGVIVRGVSVNAQPAVYGRDVAGSTAHISYLYFDGTAASPTDPFSSPTGSVAGVAIPAVHAIWSN